MPLLCPFVGKEKMNDDNDKRYVDSNLYAALQYVSNDKKTDERMYVSDINCNAKRAYERMTATKKRFGKTGGNVAYHGYQSFQTGEVTPEEAHKIGLETARQMWGKEYEIVVSGKTALGIYPKARRLRYTDTERPHLSALCSIIFFSFSLTRINRFLFLTSFITSVLSLIF